MIFNQLTFRSVGVRPVLVPLRRPVVSSLLNDRHGGLAILGIRRCAGGSSIVEIIADPTASKNFGGYQLRMHVSLLITQEKLV